MIKLGILINSHNDIFDPYFFLLSLRYLAATSQFSYDPGRGRGLRQQPHESAS